MNQEKLVTSWKALTIAACALLFTQLSNAQSGGLQIGDGISGGKGCPQGSVAFSVSPDNSAVTVLFSEYNLSLGGNVPEKEGRLPCTLDIPMQVPRGLQVAVTGLDYRGFALLPKGGVMTFKTKDGYLINGSKYEDTSDSEKEFKGPLNDNFTISRKKRELKWTNCGGRIDLSLQSTMLVKTNEHRDEAMVSIDSVDMSLGFTYRFAVRACKQEGHSERNSDRRARQVRNEEMRKENRH